MSLIDWIVLIVTLVGIILYGLYKSRSEKNLESYFLMNRSSSWYLILLGVIDITIMLFAPNGIWGYVNQRFGLVLFPTRRRLVRS